VAAGLLERSLADHGEPQVHGEHRLRAAAALETLVATRVALGDLDAAAAAAARIPGLAAGDGDDQVAALAALASARLATARGRPEQAQQALERAPERFGRLDLPYEVAQVRLELARVLAAADPEMAVAEATAARDALERLGAAGEADAADALRRSLGARGRTGPSGSAP